MVLLDRLFMTIHIMLSRKSKRKMALKASLFSSKKLYVAKFYETGIIT